MGRLAGKRALITGAGGLLGSDLARAFAREGADLVLTTRTAAKLGPLEAEIRAMGRRTAAIACDFTREADAEQLGEAAGQAFGGIDIVVFSAQPPDCNLGTLLDGPETDWKEQMQILVWGPFKTMRKLAPKMLAAGGGSVITLTSSTRDDPVTGYSAYGIAKAALWSMTLYMAKEWGPGGIRANAVQPGTVATGDDTSAAAHQEVLVKVGMMSRTSLGRVGRNEDVLGAAIYLASDEASFTSGQCIAVNGGRF